MNHVSTPVPTLLAHRRILRLRDRDGDRVECLDGSVWITQDGDPRDIVLDAGEAFTLDRRGTTLVYALANARVVVQAEGHAPARRPQGEALRPMRDLLAAPRSAA